MVYILLDEYKPLPEELLHYGVKGMRWGVRRTPEQLGRSREARAQKYEKKAVAAQKEIDRIQSSKTYTQRSKNALSKAHMNQKTQALEDAKAAREGRLTSDQKRMLKGAAIAGGVAVAIGVYSIHQSGEGNRLMMKGRQMIKGGEIFAKDPDLGAPGLSAATLYKIAEGVNPDYGSAGASMNCRRCTFTYEMRRRGYDVTATKTLMGHGQTYLGLENAVDPSKRPAKATGVIATLAKAASKRKLDKVAELALGEDQVPSGPDLPKNIFKKLKGMPDGARGELGVAWSSGGAHSIAWEIVKGKPVIFDTQTMMQFDSPGQLSNYPMSIAKAAVTRLDDKVLNEEFLMRWMKNA